MGTSESFAIPEFLDSQQEVPLLSEGEFPEEEVPARAFLLEVGGEEVLVLADNCKFLEKSSSLPKGIRL